MFPSIKADHTWKIAQIDIFVQEREICSGAKGFVTEM